MWSLPVLLKYWSLQAAGWLIVLAAAWLAAELFAWPSKLVWIIFGVWAAKDALLYPLVWRSYDFRDWRPSAYPAEGTEAIVLRRLDPEGDVRVQGERWQAASAGAVPIDEGARVRIMGRDGMTLIVTREPPPGAAQGAAAQARDGRGETSRQARFGDQR